MSAREEFELKARLEEPVDRFTGRVEEAGWSLRYRGEMSDLRLDTDGRDLEGRDEVLRVRRYGSRTDPRRVVLGWKGPARESRGFKLRDELELEVESEEAVRELLGRLGFGLVTRAIDRRIHRYEKDGVVLRIEEYPRMDVLVEVEGDPERVEERLPELGLPREAWRSWPLPRFVRRYEERVGRPARLSRRSDVGGADVG